MAKKKASVAQLKARERFVERQTKGQPKTPAEKKLESKITKATGKPYVGKR